MTIHDIAHKGTTFIGRWLFGTHNKMILNIKTLLKEEYERGKRDGLKQADEELKNKLNNGSIYKSLKK